MQEAIPYTRTLMCRTPPAPAALRGEGASVAQTVSESAVVVFGRRGCCMCHVVKRLLLGLGVNPPVFEIHEDEEERVVGELARVIYGGDDRRKGKRDEVVEFPVVFVGGELFGGLERVMTAHISGELMPILKRAGALWL